MTEKILTILTATFGGGWLIQLLFMRYEKRKKALEVKNAEISVDEKEDIIRDKKLSDAYDTIVNMQEIVNLERNKWTEIARELSGVKRELLKEKEARQLADFDKCTVSGCMDRIPPRQTKEQ